jgi:tetraacyldisaccharide 4'-kinase
MHVEETDECVAGLRNESHRHAGQGIQARTLKGQIQSHACDGRSIVGNAEDPRAVRCLTETIGLTNHTGRVGIARSLFLWYGLVGTNWVQPYMLPELQPNPLMLAGSIKERLTAWWWKTISAEQRSWPATLVRGNLWLASLGYGVAVHLRNRFYDTFRSRVLTVPVPVISVGNLTAGGTGKTPLVAWLAKRLLQTGLRVAILSRGYRASAATSCLPCEHAGSDAIAATPWQQTYNDEGRELLAELPGILLRQGKNRAELARQAIADGAQVLLLDDGFQHRRLHRDLDIVLLDATNPWGWGHLLPRGMLREPRSALRRADVIVLTRCDLVSEKRCRELQRQIAQTAPQAVMTLARHAPAHLVNSEGTVAGLQQLRGQKILAFCGLGNPAAFLAGLRQLGAEIVASCFCPDHCDYSQILDQLRNWASAYPQASFAVTTRKDLVKLPMRELAGKPLWALVCEFAWIEGGDILWQRVRQILRPSETSTTSDDRNRSGELAVLGTGHGT